MGPQVLMPEYTPLPVPHKCNLWEECLLDDEYKLLFCSLCRQVVGYEHEGKRMIKRAIVEQLLDYKQNQLSEQTRKDSV